VLVLGGHLGETLVGDVPAADDVAEEGHDVVRPLRATERHQQEGVVA
jgi:hypothetical protein